MDTLSEGLSNLTPTSPTTSGPAPVFPVLTCDVSRSEPTHMIHTPLSQSAPSALCHIRTDHAYQVTSLFNASTCLTHYPGSVLAADSGVCVSYYGFEVDTFEQCFCLRVWVHVYTLETSYSFKSPTQGCFSH